MPIKKVLVCDNCGVEKDVDTLEKPRHPFIDVLTLYRYIGTGSSGYGTCESTTLYLCRECGEKMYHAIADSFPAVRSKTIDSFKGYGIDEYHRLQTK